MTYSSMPESSHFHSFFVFCKLAFPREELLCFQQVRGYKESDPGLTAEEGVLVLLYTPPALPFPPCCCMALLLLLSIQKSELSLRTLFLGFFQALFYEQGGRNGEIWEKHFSAPCSFILAAFPQPMPILHNVHSCCMSHLASGLNGVRNSSSQLKIVPSCNKTAFASFAMNDKQELLQIKHPFFFSLLHNGS